MIIEITNLLVTRRPSECSFSSTSTSPRASFSTVLSGANSNLFQSKESEELLNKLGDGGVTGGCWEKHDLLPVGWTIQKLDDADVIFRCSSSYQFSIITNRKIMTLKLRFLVSYVSFFPFELLLSKSF